MAIGKWLVMTALCAAALPVSAHAQAGPRVPFNVGEQAFTAEGPAGFCIPAGTEAAAFAAFAEIDTLNYTHAEFIACNTPDGDYALVKSPRGAPALSLPRAVFLPMMARQFEGQIGSRNVASALDKARDDMAKGTGEAMSLENGTVQGAGFDDVCAYIVGKAEVVAGDASASMTFVSCMTLIGERVLAIHSYSKSEGGTTVAELKARSRAIAAAITAAP